MDYLKNWVITLCATLIFISSIELIIPNGSIKKYVKFILGLILMAVILNPIVEILTGDKKDFHSSVKNYVEAFENDNLNFQNNNIETNEIFIDKLEYSCNKMLIENYPNFKFTTKIKGNIDMDKLQLDFKEVNITYDSKDFGVVEKIQINVSNNKKGTDEDKITKDIKCFVANQLKVNEEKINVVRGSF